MKKRSGFRAVVLALVALFFLTAIGCVGVLIQPLRINGNALVEGLEAKAALEIYIEHYGLPKGWNRIPEGCEDVGECLPEQLKKEARDAAAKIIVASLHPREDRKKYVLWSDGHKTVYLSDSYEIAERFVKPLLDEMGFDWQLSSFFWDSIGIPRSEYLKVIVADFKAEVAEKKILLAGGDDFPFSEKQLLWKRAEVLFPGGWGQAVNLSALGVTPEQARRLFGE